MHGLIVLLGSSPAQFTLFLAFISLGSISAGLLLFNFSPLVMDVYTPPFFQKTKQIVCLTSEGISGPGLAWEGSVFIVLWADHPGYFQRES